MTPEDVSPIQLVVAEGLTEDAKKGIARMDRADMEAIGVSMGEVIEVIGRRTTVTRAYPAFGDSIGRKTLQIDGVTRENSNVGLGERVTVKRANAQQAKAVVLSPIDVSQRFDTETEVQQIRRLLIGMPALVGDKIVLSRFGPKEVALRVEGTTPRGPVFFGANTVVKIKSPDSAERRAQRVTYEDIGGLEKEVRRIRELIELPLKYPAVFRTLGIEAPKGVLLYGPPGTGKTLIARAVADESQVYFVHVNGPEIMHKYYGESEARLREVFEEARRHAPAVLFLDELDAIAPRRAQVHGDVEKRVVAQLLALMDGLEARGNVVVIGATNIPDAVDPALRRPGRFDREIVVNVPDRQGRLEILKIHSRGMTLASDVDLERIAAMTHGFVGADLAALCRESGMYALRRLLPELQRGAGDICDVQIEVRDEDFRAALLEVEPSATREFLVEIPDTSWSDIGGLARVKEHLLTLVEWPLKYQHVYGEFGLKAPKGILFSGPTGTGKTLLARALASRTQLNFINVPSASLFSRWQGESEKALRDVFRKARQAAPSILFFDEVDVLVPARAGETGGVGERVASQFLAELDGLEELRGVIVLAATNRIEALDAAVLRPGRFDHILEFPVPDLHERVEILKVHLRKKPLADDVGIDDLAGCTEGLVGAEIEWICQQATLLALGTVFSQRAEHEITARLVLKRSHFEEALQELERRRTLQRPSGGQSQYARNNRLGLTRRKGGRMSG
ncbi:MAG: CDC48 family AAA ATPase [Bacillota bacterium]